THKIRLPFIPPSLRLLFPPASIAHIRPSPDIPRRQIRQPIVCSRYTRPTTRQFASPFPSVLSCVSPPLAPIIHALSAYAVPFVCSITFSAHLRILFRLYLQALRYSASNHPLGLRHICALRPRLPPSYIRHYARLLG